MSCKWMEFLPMALIGVLFIMQIAIGLYLLPEISQNQMVAYLGVGMYFVSGLVFGMLPVFELRKKGEVSDGDSYVHTTRVVDSGLYSIVRHPQYLTWMLWAIAGVLLFQHWAVLLIGIPIVPLTYLDMIREERENVRKFGEEYKRYMQRVPRANFLWGIVRSLRGGRS